MMPNIIFLKPYLSEKVWGGSHLRQYGIDVENKKIGEAWLISGIKGYSSIVYAKGLKPITLDKFYKQHRNWFGNYKSKEYPLLLKLLDCNQNLSIQVHPTDQYCKNHKQYQSKNEAWYILDCKKNAKIVYGHKARAKQELTTLVRENKWNKLLAYTNVVKDKIYYVPSGTIHALLSGLVVFEIQQPSQTTFRLYDYEREKTNPSRRLTIKESIDNTIVPFKKPILNKKDNELLTTPYFSIKKIINKGKKTYQFNQTKWLQCFVVGGKGTINNLPIIKGSTFIISNNQKNFILNGNLIILLTYIR